MLILYKYDRNVTFVLLTKTSNEFQATADYRPVHSLLVLRASFNVMLSLVCLKLYEYVERSSCSYGENVTHF